MSFTGMKIDNFNKVPSKHQHIIRNNFNKQPIGILIYQGNKDEYGQKIFIDEYQKEWHELKWYNSIFHNPIVNKKFVYYHTDNTNLSSEITVPKKYIEHIPDGSERFHSMDTDEGSFNYRDFYKTSRIAHFLADVLPNAIYCSCV